MNWLSYLLCLWVLLGLELGLRPALSIGPTGVSPSLVLPLVMLVAMHAPATTAQWSAIIAGLLLDLTAPMALEGGGEVRVPGPRALGLWLGVLAALWVRSMLIKRNPLTLGAVCVLGSLVCAAVVCAIMSVRTIAGDPVAWSLGRELWVRVLSSLYTGVVGVAAALVLYPLAGVLGLPTNHASGRRFGSR